MQSPHVRTYLRGEFEQFKAFMEGQIGCGLTTVYADWFLSKPMFQLFYGSKIKSDFMKKIVGQWKVDGVIIHLERVMHRIDFFMETLDLDRLE